MSLFQEYIQPLTTWLYNHPNYALFATFLISLSESLAIIGSIIPGSVTMTAIGILAGAGVMRIDLTLLAATLGAIAGDGASYLLGEIYCERLINIWPFKNYPNWLKYGKDYFAKHGSISVLIGRFFGPMRSIIPVIAGMMKMNRWHFFIANAVSAIMWSIIYVVPGILIGEASSELSAESFTRLFILIILLLIIIWIISVGLKWLLTHTNQILKLYLHRMWLWLGTKSQVTYYWQCVTPAEEVDHYATASIILSCLLSVCFAIAIILASLQTSWVTTINQPVFLFFQSLRTQAFDAFFIMIELMVKPLSLCLFVMAQVIYSLAKRNWQTCCYWISVAFSCLLLNLFCQFFITLPIPHGLVHATIPPAFPERNLAIATALFGFFIFYTHNNSWPIAAKIIRIALLIILVLAGIATCYLGDNWLSSVLAAYFIGLLICLLHWMFYRRLAISQAPTAVIPIVLTCMTLLIATGITYIQQFSTLQSIHRPYLEQYVINDQVWWNQQQPLLPLFSTNRIGKRTGLYNIQYAGSVSSFQEALESDGWKAQPDSFFHLLLMRAGGQNATEKLPLMAQLYLNRKPTLNMTYLLEDQQTLLILNLWRSNYHLRHYHQPIWIGSVHLHRQKTSQHSAYPKLIAIHHHLKKALHRFKVNQITLPQTWVQNLPQPSLPVLLIIREPEGLNTVDVAWDEEKL